MLRSSFFQRTFNFNFDARTSRGSMKERPSWFLKIWDDSAPGICGWGECGPLPGLSPEEFTSLEPVLALLTLTLNQERLQLGDFLDSEKSLGNLRKNLQEHFPAFTFHSSSVLFAAEAAILDLANGGRRVIFDNGFHTGTPIPINGLVWMGGLDYMLQQVELKFREGYTCIKLKIGGLDFEKELDIVQFIRRKYFRDNIIIRLDANGAFKPGEALDKIARLTPFGIHSLEQPLRVASPELADVCAKSGIPIALDEELIGIHELFLKQQLLDTVKPAFLILKPTLHGGFSGCAEWIALAEERGMGWWMTSALESNVGLNAISQFSAQYPTTLAQGLGTGAIYTNNIASPLKVKNGFLTYNLAETWDSSII